MCFRQTKTFSFSHETYSFSISISNCIGIGPPVSGGGPNGPNTVTSPKPPPIAETARPEETTEVAAATTKTETATELDLVALGINKENVTSKDLCKLVGAGSSRRKRQAAEKETNRERDREETNRERDGEETNRERDREDKNSPTNENGSNSQSSTGRRSNSTDQGSSATASASTQGSSSSSSTPLVDLFINPQKAEIRKAFEKQTVKKYQDLFANINLTKVNIHFESIINHLDFSGVH